MIGEQCKDVEVHYLKGERTRELRGYEGLYGVSNKGNVYNLRSGCLVEPQRGAYVTLSKQGRAVSYRIGDLVAREWIENRLCLDCVRHKDGDVRNNRVENLEWSSTKEMVRRGKGSERARKVLQLDAMGALVGKYNSLSDASVVCGVDKSSISKCCRGSAQSAGGYRWKFE